MSQPVVLTRPVGASLSVVRACSQAREAGVRAGMTLGQAQALLPQVAVLADDPAGDGVVLERLARWALRFSPNVEAVSPDVLLVDVTGCARLFGGESNIVRQAVGGLAQQGFVARGALADTVGAACALARGGSEATVVVPPGLGSMYLAPLSPEVLRIEPWVSAQLDALGVRTIGDLLTLPRSALPGRFGAGLVLRLQQALGEVCEPVTPVVSEDVLRVGLGFDSPVADFAMILGVGQRLLADLLTRLRVAARALQVLECILYFEDVPPRVLAVGLARASRIEKHIGELLRQRLERTDLSPGVMGVRLVARETVRFGGVQEELFEAKEPGDDEALGTLIDRLASRLGYAALVRLRLEDDHQPERAYRYVLVSDVGCEVDEVGGREELVFAVDGAGDEGVVAEVASRNPRPVRLLARPLPVRVIALVPDGPPTWLAYGGQEQFVVDVRGPERIETAWWRGADVRRDYFRVTVECGEQLWVFRDKAGKRWYLHGYFA